MKTPTSAAPKMTAKKKSVLGHHLEQVMAVYGDFNVAYKRNLKIRYMVSMEIDDEHETTFHGSTEVFRDKSQSKKCNRTFSWKNYQSGQKASLVFEDLYQSKASESLERRMRECLASKEMRENLAHALLNSVQDTRRPKKSPARRYKDLDAVMVKGEKRKRSSEDDEAVSNARKLLKYDDGDCFGDFLYAPTSDTTVTSCQPSTSADDNSRSLSVSPAPLVIDTSSDEEE